MSLEAEGEKGARLILLGACWGLDCGGRGAERVGGAGCLILGGDCAACCFWGEDLCTCGRSQYCFFAKGLYWDLHFASG